MKWNLKDKNSKYSLDLNSLINSGIILSTYEIFLYFCLKSIHIINLFCVLSNWTSVLNNKNYHSKTNDRLNTLIS